MMRFIFSVLFFSVTMNSFANPLKNIVVFGDSLSDNGNLYAYMHKQLPQSPPYYQGRFSDGPVWAEFLAQNYFNKEASSHLLDYAFGGAGVLSDENDDEELFTLKREVNTYLLAHNDQADPSSMFFIWIGGNNYLGLPDEMDSAVTDVINGIQKDVEKLISHGAKHITLMNLPDLSKTPMAREWESEAEFLAYSELHNQRLHVMYESLRSAHPEVQWFYFDTFQVFQDIYQHPTEYGYSNLTDTCNDPSAKAVAPRSNVLQMVKHVRPLMGANNQPKSCEGYVFFDLIHPTQHTHRVTAEHIKQLFDQAKVAFTH